MKPELFKRFSDEVIAFVEGFFAEANVNRDFDIADPIFSLGGIVDDEFGITLFNDENAMPMFKIMGKDETVALFKAAAKKLIEVKPETRDTLGTVILAGGWIKDPQTLEHIGENILLTIEDPDRNVRFVSWTLTRPDDQDTPVTLDKKVDELSENYHFSQSGKMQNIFDLEPRPDPEDKEALN